VSKVQRAVLLLTAGPTVRLGRVETVLWQAAAEMADRKDSEWCNVETYRSICCNNRRQVSLL